MAIKVVAGGKVGRGRRGPRRVGGLVLAAAGDGWALWVPLEKWQRMTDHERDELAKGQAALLEG